MSEAWTFVCAGSELLPGEMKSVFDDVTGTPIVVFNLDGELAQRGGGRGRSHGAEAESLRRCYVE